MTIACSAMHQRSMLSVINFIIFDPSIPNNYLIFANVLFISRLMTPHFGNKPSTLVRFIPKPFHFASVVSQPPPEMEQVLAS